MARPTHEELAVYLDAHIAEQDLVQEQDLRWWCLWALDGKVSKLLKAQIKDVLWSDSISILHPNVRLNIGKCKDRSLIRHVFNGLSDRRILLLTDDRWRIVFSQASGKSSGYPGEGIATPLAVVDGVSVEPFEIQDVKELIGICEGQDDSTAWVAAGRLYDRRWFVVRAGCGNSNGRCWKCGNSLVANSKKKLLKFGVADEEKERMGL